MGYSSRMSMVLEPMEVRLDNIETEQHAKMRLEETHGAGNVWTPREFSEKFDAVQFLDPYVEVVRKSDGVAGCMQMQHAPMMYFNFLPTID